MKVIRKVLSTQEQENKSTNFLQLQLVSLDTEAVSQIFSLTFAGPFCSVIQCGHRCETQLQPLVPDRPVPAQVTLLKKTLSYEDLHYTLTVMDLLLLTHLKHPKNTIWINTFSSVLLSPKNKRSSQLIQT